MWKWWNAREETLKRVTPKRSFPKYSKKDTELGQYPEALLQNLGNTWVREAPSSAELFYYVLSDTTSTS